MKHGDYDRMLDRQMENHFFPKDGYQPDGVTYGMMTDTGDTYPVCDVCGEIGTMEQGDGDECPVCRAKWEAASNA